MNRYDEMKDLLRKVREHKKKLNEMDQTSTLQQNELEDEQEKFRTAVGGVVDFGAFKVSENNIEWLGTFPTEKMNWNFSLDSNTGCYISTNNTQLTDEVLVKLQKLNAYYSVWAEYWTNEMK